MAEGGSDNSDDLPGDHFTNPDEAEKAALDETEVIFKNFLATNLKSRAGFTDSDMAVTNIPLLESLGDFDESDGTYRTALTPEQNQKFEDVGRKLADFSDELQDKYGNVWVKLISNLNLGDCNSDFVFEKFSHIARRLFEEGITWSRVVSLLYFGYQMAVHSIRTGTHAITDFLKKIVKFVMKFLMKEGIIRLIINQGGWVSYITFIDVLFYLVSILE